MLATDKLTPVLKAVFQAKKRHYAKARDMVEPKIAIYMSEKFFRECNHSIRCGVSSGEYEFFSDQKIMGHPVYVVIPMPLQEHPDYKILIEDSQP